MRTTMISSAGIAKFFETTSVPANIRPTETTALPDEGSRLRFAVLMLAFGFAFLVMASLKPWGNTTAYMFAFLFTGAAIAYMVLHRDALLARMFVASMIAGWVKLYADWYIVVAEPSLVYTQEGPFVVSSPLYMPFSWAFALWAIAIVTRWIDRRYGLIAAMAGGLAIGALNLPVYEHLAAGAGWWTYHGVPLLGHAPLFLIIAEPLITAILPLLGRAIEEGGEFEAVGAGLVIGAWIYLAIRLGLVLFG